MVRAARIPGALMKIDPTELAQLAAAQPRLDLYGSIHKALRAFMTDTLLALGRVDVEDEQALADATARVTALMDFCVAHLEHENRFVHTAMEARAPGASAAVAHDHEEHLHETAQLRAAAAALQAAAPAVRPAFAHQLYRALAVFVADNFRHMHVEETAHNAVLWARYTDAELTALHDALVASIPPEQMMGVMRWMVPALTPAERLGLLTDMRAKAPPPAFDAVLAMVRDQLPTTDWAKLARGLGLPPVPGLVVV
jgi:hypothetical protein